jgi:transposase
LRYADGDGPTAIQKALGLSRPTIYKCIDKALAAGVEAGLQDRYHRAKEPVITEESKAWVLNLACTKPKDHGLAAELWSLSALARFTREHAAAQGHPSLMRAGKATIWRILHAGEIKPHKVRYYLERRDAQFEEKMREVLMVYQEVALQNPASASNEGASSVITVSLDEKPGVQAIENTAPDLPPVPGQHSTWSRDHEYKRHGTLSILAAVDLHNGEIFAQVHPRHRSREYILLLKELDDHYPKDCTIRVILDNHSAHISKEIMAYLASRPNRFIYVHTPKHGSWLNLIETVFSRMARTFLKGIRVASGRGAGVGWARRDDRASVVRVPAPFIGGMILPCLIIVAPMCRVAPISSPSISIGAKRFIDYIYWNPVKHGYVAQVSHWPC